MNRYSVQKINEIHLNAVASAERLKASEADLIVNLQKVRKSRVHRHMGYKNLYNYAFEALKLTEGQAYTFTSVAEKAAELPDLQKALLNGEVSVSMAKRVLPVINESNESEWVEALKTKTKREIEKAVAKESPRSVVQEQAKYVSENILELRLAISEENLTHIRRSQDLLAQSLGRYVTMEEVLAHLAKEFNKINDPVQKAERARARAQERGKEKPSESKPKEFEILCPGIKPANSREKPAAVYHAVNLRDKRQCQAKLPNGKICGDRKWIDIHHIKEVAEGGETVVENLITFCRAHHKMWHQGQRMSNLLTPDQPGLQ